MKLRKIQKWRARPISTDVHRILTRWDKEMISDRILLRNLKKDKKAISPAVSTTILTAAIVTMLIIAVAFANSYMNAQVAIIEFKAMKQFMQTIGLQTDDVAWTPGRTQTVRYASKYGYVKVESAALNYSFYFDNNLLANFIVGAILFNVPVSAYSLGNGYFEQLFPSSDSFLQYNASAPICRVFVVEKMPMLDGGYARIVVCPLVRQINSVVNNITYVKLYLPDFEAGPNPQYSQSVTLTGKNVNRTANKASNLTIGLGFPNSLGAGLTNDFFNFARTSETLNVLSNSVVEIYTGEVIVSLGLYT